jgi:putative flavoprotein involved in K+ transport
VGTISTSGLPTNGATLLGHLQGVEGEKLAFALDVEQTLTRADEYCQRSPRSVDDYIQKTGLNAPAPKLRQRAPRFRRRLPRLTCVPPALRQLCGRLDSATTSVEFSCPCSMMLPSPSTAGARIQGVYFLGLRFLYTPFSSFVFGVGRDAAYLAEHIIARR